MYRKSKTYNYACARLYIHIRMYVCMYKLRNVYLVMRLLSSFLLHLLIINYIILLLSSKSVVSNNERKRGRDSVNSLSGSVRKCQIKKKKRRMETIDDAFCCDEQNIFNRTRSERDKATQCIHFVEP